MNRNRACFQRALAMYGAAGLCALILPACAARAEWPQFGGPDRNFIVETEGLADTWPEDGPRQLWKRELGDGYSTIVADGDLLFTMYRNVKEDGEPGDDEFTVAIDRKTGRTVWEHKNHAPYTSLMKQFGPGPHTTPLVAGDYLYSVGTNAVMHCYDKRTGEVIWKRDLPDEFGAPIPGRGYGNSPIAYKDTVIVAVDRERDEDDDEEAAEDSPAKAAPAASQSVVAFDRKTGDVVWKSQDLPVSYASPILIEFNNRPQLVMLMAEDVVGLNPDNGERLWHADVEPRGANLSTPVWDGKDHLFCSSAYDSGSRAFRLVSRDGRTDVEQLWYSRKMRVHHGNPILIGDYAYGSSGDFGPAFFMGMNLTTGEIAWRERGFKKATCVYADGKIILLDEEGDLALVSVSPGGMTVHARTKVAEPYAWAAPTLIGTHLFVRDRKHIMAFDLG